MTRNETLIREINLEKIDSEELYKFAKEWKSDLEFFRDDLQFLSNLIENYFVWIVEKGNVDDIRVLNDALNDLKRKCRVLLKRLAKYMGQLAKSMETISTSSILYLNEEHRQLKKDMEKLTKTFREVKKDVFVIAEHAVDAKRLQFIA